MGEVSKLKCLLGLLLSFCLSVAALQAILPAPGLFGLKTEVPQYKWEWFVAHKDEYDTVYLGASEYYRNIAAHEIDLALQAQGYPSKSFNLSAPNMNSLEFFNFFQALVEIKPAQLKFLITDLILDGSIDFRNFFTQRVIQRYSLRNTLFASKFILESNLSFRAKVLGLAAHNFAFLCKLVGLGRLAALHLDYVSGLNPQKLEGLGELRDGFLPIESDPGLGENISRRKNDFLNSPQLYQRLIRELSEGVGERLMPMQIHALNQIFDEAKAQGWEHVMLLPPVIDSVSWGAVNAKKDKQIRQTLFEFQDPKVYPELFEIKNHFDMNHLNEKGTKVLTPLIIQKLTRVRAQKK